MIIPRIKKITQKRLRQLERGSNTKRYQNWRDAVLARDNYECQMNNCRSKDLLEVHHIKKFSSAVHLRYDTLNGITLCKKHHKQVTGYEERYEMIFFNIVKANAEKKQQDTDTN